MQVRPCAVRQQFTSYIYVQVHEGSAKEIRTTSDTAEVHGYPSHPIKRISKLRLDIMRQSTSPHYPKLCISWNIAHCILQNVNT